MKQIEIETTQTLASLQARWQNPETWLPQWKEVWASEQAMIVETDEAILRIGSRRSGLRVTLLQGNDPGLRALAENLRQIPCA